jgi:glutathionylspermidine synthase
MITLQPLGMPPEVQLNRLGWDWMLGKDTLPYLTGEVVRVREREAEAYAKAAGQLYEMLVSAGQYVIDRNLFDKLGIPANLVKMIRITWEDDRNLHLYGRFDLAGGLDGEPIKLIEFNADTATCIPETAVVQWAQLLANGLSEKSQFNTVYEALTVNFQRLREANPDLAPTLLISSLPDSREDDTNVTLLGEAAKEAGFEVSYRYIDEVDFSPDEGIFTEEEDGSFYRYHYWFKLVPWEYIAHDEPALTDILTEITVRRKAVILNPAYTLLFQSKAILKVLWDLYPYHPLLLETIDEPFAHKKSVEKVLFGREGANVRILDPTGEVLNEEAGDYGNYSKIYQEYTPLLRDAKDYHYQAGVFFAWEPCGLGYRRGGPIIGNTSQFVGHIVD